MSNKINLMIGYSPESPSISWGKGWVLKEVKTGGKDYDGFHRKETIGVAKNEYGDLCIFSGSVDRLECDKIKSAIFSIKGPKLLASLLRKLAGELDSVG